MNPDGKIRILVADDHTLLREALCDVLEINPDFEVVAQSGDAAGALSLARRNQPDVAVLDVEMPGNDPVRTVQQIRKFSPSTRIVILSMYADPKLVQQLLQEKVRGYLHKSIGRQELTSAIRSIYRDPNRIVISISHDSLSLAPLSEPNPLSERETEILSLVATAMSNRQIAAQLAIVEGTVKLHLRNIFRKLNAVSRIDAVNKASAASLIAWPAMSQGARQ
ncbi:response regulator transcription factor [Streptomyces sp. NPDC002668]|uniref:response regulator transcription factor n=1 Tax=Streptomyces sp. NPDC002668 TaxID=3154422 RepID=UPI00331EF0E4